MYYQYFLLTNTHTPPRERVYITDYSVRAIDDIPCSGDVHRREHSWMVFLYMSSTLFKFHCTLPLRYWTGYDSLIDWHVYEIDCVLDCERLYQWEVSLERDYITNLCARTINDITDLDFHCDWESQRYLPAGQHFRSTWQWSIENEHTSHLPVLFSTYHWRSRSFGLCERGITLRHSRSEYTIPRHIWLHAIGRSVTMSGRNEVVEFSKTAKTVGLRLTYRAKPYLCSWLLWLYRHAIELWKLSRKPSIDAERKTKYVAHLQLQNINSIVMHHRSLTIETFVCGFQQLVVIKM
jgi:hypothetical protein